MKPKSKQPAAKPAAKIVNKPAHTQRGPGGEGPTGEGRGGDDGCGRSDV